MVIENKNWLHDLYCQLLDGYRHKEIFKGFCSLMSDYKKMCFSYDELYMALSRSEKIAEDIVELSILTKNNFCYKYRVSEIVYEYFCNWFFHHLLHSTQTMLIKDFLEREDCAEYKEFDVFISEQYKTASRRTMDYESDYTGDNIAFFENVKKNKSIKKFCKMIDNLDGKYVNMFEVFDMYRSVYECVWCRGNKHHIKELIIYDAVISFFKYSEVKRKHVKFFDYLIVEIMKKYVMGHKKLDVTEMFPHEDLLPCPFCGKEARIYMKVFWFDLIVTIECDDCFHVMRKYVIESNGLNQEQALYQFISGIILTADEICREYRANRSRKAAYFLVRLCASLYTERSIFLTASIINVLVGKWNRRTKIDMWLDDETLPDELPECEPDMFPKKVYAPGLKPCPFCGSKAGLIKINSSKGRDGKRDPEGIKTIKVVCSKGCFSASHFGTPERIPDKDTIGYMAYRWNQRKECI